MKRQLLAAAAAVLTACGGSVLDKSVELADAVYCLRTTVTYSREGVETIITGHGTAFGVNIAGEVLFVTNKHCTNPPERVGYSRSVTYSLVSHADDNDASDDTTLELVAESDSDLALLKTGEELRAYTPVFCNPEVGVESVIIGYPLGIDRVVDEGVVSNNDVRGEGLYLSSNDSLPGMSGSPAYTRTNGAVCLYGVVNGMTMPGGYAVVVPSSALEELIWNYYAEEG